ncbi:GspH/FimT family pseudopilin [Pseudoalteromonas sp. SSM20]|uniref:GspH/FimT family pseudopilin n=1 Tax=Pseudoalteromonas sp. SSM20 TaxID=3139394 RepID=UPI003BA9CA61
MKRYYFGHTLVEVLASAVILGIVTSVTLPNLSRFLAQSRLDNSITKIIKSLHLARGYAVSHATNITVCPLISGSCTDHWQNAIYIFEDGNSNLSLDENEYIIKVIAKIHKNDELDYPRTAITYRADGSINFMQSGSFLYCNQIFTDLTGNQITVSQVGRVRIKDSDKCKIPTL